MRYMITYCKTQTAITYKKTEEEAIEITKKLRKAGYQTTIWEETENGVKIYNETNEKLQNG